MHTRLRQERGQALVEFALVLPVLLLIIVGILYFGRYEDYANQETHLAETGARSAAVSSMPAPNLQSYTQSQAQPELQAGSSDVTKAAAVWVYQPTGATYAIGQPIRVCVVATVQFPTLIGTPTTTIAQAATMRIEQVPSVNPTTDPYLVTNPTGTRPLACPTS